MKRLFLITIILSSFVCADSVSVGVGTIHFTGNDHFNNNNNLVSIEIDGYAASSFVNSYGRQSYALTKEIGLNKHVSILAGASYGYDYDCLDLKSGGCNEFTYSPDLLPMAALKISHRMDNVSASVVIIDYVSFALSYHF